VSLSNKFRYFRKGAHTAIDPTKKVEGLTKLRELNEGETYILHPSDLVLGSTEEYFEIPDLLAARVEGKSSLGRIGLVIHATAGWIDPGFKGNITLEMSNNSPLPIVLTPGMLIGQIAFMRLTNPAERPYGTPGLGSKYQGDTEPTEGKGWK
jgi:dCTP deaminase